jgi:hypothetical protein
MPVPVAHVAWALLTVVVLGLTGCTAGASGSPSRTGSSDFPSVILDTTGQAAAGYGFTSVDATPVLVGGVPAGTSALVWLGGYDNASCSMSWSDDQVRDAFARYRLAASPRVLGYFIADEPNSDDRCPQAGQQVGERSRLVRELDPDTRHFTLANIDDPGHFAAFRSSVDVLATDPYPCRVDTACDWSMIPNYIDRLRQAGVTRYMGMLQAFQDQDRDWRWPTPSELARMIDQWRSSDWCGALTFSWSYRGSRLADKPALLDVLRTFNRDRPSPSAPCTG